MKKLCIVSILIILVLLIGYLFISKVLVLSDIKEGIYKMLYGDPIDVNTGEINNQYFGIDDTGATETSKQINEAIEYADKNNINYIKMKKGNYKVEGIGSYKKEKGIIIKSNLEIDFNGSTIIHIKNNDPTYAILCIYEQNNIKISNGILIGDKNEHDYTGSTHEWGMGIDIRGGSNIQIQNFEIYNMTGDGIYIASSEGKNLDINTSNNILIENCNIHDCRRQGISIICANNVEIKNNEIHNIGGVLPGNGIDLEANTNNQTIDAIKIYNNKFYELEGKAAVEVFRGIQTVEIYNNEINGDILCFDAKTEISIYNNNIKNGVIRFYKDEFLQSLGNYMKKAIIRNNNLYNTYFDINDVQYIDLNNNQIEEGYIIVNSCNGQISDNNITNQQKTDFAYKYAAKTEGNTYILKVLNNQANGEFNNLEIIQKIDSLIIKRE